MKHASVACAIAFVAALPCAALAFTDAEATKAFNQADKDKNGTLDKTEFRTFIKAIADLGHKEAKRAVRYGALGYGIAWDRADTDNSDTVTLAELDAIR